MKLYIEVNGELVEVTERDRQRDGGLHLWDEDGHCATAWCGCEEFCGCCGNHAVDTWCSPCQPHVLPDGFPWLATFQAQHGAPCPFQAGAS